MAPVTRALPALLFVLAAVACGERRSAPAVTRGTSGDTLILSYAGPGRWGADARLERVARVGALDGSDSVVLGQIIALAESPDDRILATDLQRLAVRVFSPTLEPLAIWGRDGAGPGELRRPDGGLAVFTDGRVAVRDPGNARMQVYSPNGTPLEGWRVVDPGLRTRDNFGRQGDTLLSRVVVDYTGPIDEWKYGLARIAADGRVLDTLLPPAPALPRQSLVARGGNNTAEMALPFAPTSHWAWHPTGGFAEARGDRYAITWPRVDGVLRVARDVDAVAVSSAEAAQERDYVTKGLQWLDPAWAWTGPEIPSVKPFISGLYVGTDGSVWVLREGEAVDREDPDYRPNDASSVERRLRSRLSFDVFDANGDFLGTLEAPESLRLRPQPLLSATGIVGLGVDETGLPQLVRYRVVTTAGR